MSKVTKQINTLEQEFGVTLFIRSTRHVELTPAGMSFYKDAKDIVLKSQIAVNRVQRQNMNSDSIRIGLSNPTALIYLTPILKKVYTAHPEIRPTIGMLRYKIVLNLFLENKLDILFYFKENMPIFSIPSGFSLKAASSLISRPPFSFFTGILNSAIIAESIVQNKFRNF